MRNVSDENCRENQNTPFMFSAFLLENLSVYEMLKNTVEAGRPRMTMWCMNTAYSIRKATNTFSECVKLYSFPLQQRLHERPSMSRFTYIACIDSVVWGSYKSQSFWDVALCWWASGCPRCEVLSDLNLQSPGLFNPLKWKLRDHWKRQGWLTRNTKSYPIMTESYSSSQCPSSALNM
jgi:hypothetical protein